LARGLALAGQTDARAVLDARRDRHLQGALPLHRADALADLARIADHPSLAAAGRTGSLNQEEPLLRTHLAGAAAGGAPLRLARGPRAGPGGAPLAGGPPQARLGAGEGFRQLDLARLADVVAGARATRAAAPSAHELAEHLIEDVAQAAPGREVETGVEPAGS